MEYVSNMGDICSGEACGRNTVDLWRAASCSLPRRVMGSQPADLYLNLTYTLDKVKQMYRDSERTPEQPGCIPLYGYKKPLVAHGTP
jgi:hypothetical protein